MINVQDNEGGETYTLDISGDYDEGAFLSLVIDGDERSGLHIDLIITDPDEIAAFREEVLRALADYDREAKR